MGNADSYHFRWRAINRVQLFAIITLCANGVFATNDLQFSERNTVEVGGNRFKFAIDLPVEEGFKVRISKEINGEWVRVYRAACWSDYYHGFEMIDWNNDGFYDVKLRFIDNSGFNNLLFLYDSLSGQFRNIDRYWWFSGQDETDFQVVTMPSCYYGFQQRGCASSNLECYLYCVEYFKIRQLGQVRMNECDSAMTVEIYKCSGPGEALIPIVSIPMKYVWDNYGNEDENSYEHYLRKYWEKHASEFIE